MGAVGYTILLAFGGTLSAALFTFVVGLAGAPGAFLTHSAMRRTRSLVVPPWGLLLTVAGQLYASLAFVAFIIQTSSSRLAGVAGFGTWIAWTVTFLVACAPAFIALKNAARVEVRKVQHSATTFTAPLTALGFFVFVFAPGVLRVGWGWVPHF